MKNLALIRWICWIIVVAGGINWGLWGLFRLNLVEAILGGGFLSRIVYIIVGLAAGFLIYSVVVKKEAV